MKLPFKRSKSKKAKAADVLGSVAKLWSELQIAKRASKGVEQGAKTARKIPAKAVGGVALLGGAGALIARKLKGGGQEPLPYVPPHPSPAPAAAEPVPWNAPSLAATPPVQEADAGAPAGEEPGGGVPGGDEEPASDEPDGDEHAGDDDAPR